MLQHQLFGELNSIAQRSTNRQIIQIPCSEGLTEICSEMSVSLCVTTHLGFNWRPVIVV